MNISCEVIKDLLPLYHDGVCSADSRKIVEEHLEHCENCRDELKSMDRELPVAKRNENLSEAEIVKKLSKCWKVGMIRSLFKGALSALATVIIFLLIFHLFVGIKIA